MVATTDQKARLLDLVTGVLELTREGKRDAGKVANVLQVIKDDPRFATRLLSPDGKPIFLRDMAAKAKWKLVQDVEDDPVPANQLELVSFLKRGESYVSGETMRERATQENASLGQCQAEYLLEHQEKIPSEWRNYYLIFPGTVWRTPGGNLGIPYLYWGGGRRDLDFGWLEGAWGSGDRLLSPSK